LTYLTPNSLSPCVGVNPDWALEVVIPEGVLELDGVDFDPIEV